MSQIFDRFTVSRFRGLSDLVLNDMRRINVIVGTNDAGKTSLLEAMQLCSAPHDFSSWARVATSRNPTLVQYWLRGLGSLFPISGKEIFRLDRRGVRGDGINFASQIEIAADGASGPIGFRASIKEVYTTFPQDEIQSELQAALAITVEIDRIPDAVTQAIIRNSASRSPRIEFDDAFKRFTFTVPLAGGVQWSSWGDELPIVSLAAHSFDRYADPTRTFSRARLDLNSTDSIIEIAQSVDSRIAGIEILDNGHWPELYVSLSNGTVLPLSSFGHGLRQALMLALMTRDAFGGALLIDEVDAGIHVSAMTGVFKGLLEAASRNNVQLVLTTHSLEAVDAILKSDPTSGEDFALYRIDNESTSTRVQRLGEAVLRSLRSERGLDIR